MALLRSIAKASADAMPPQAAAPLEEHRSNRMRRSGSVGGGSRLPGRRAGSSGGAGSAASSGANQAYSPFGEYYRLPWYRRPLPSSRPTSSLEPTATTTTRRNLVRAASAPRAGYGYGCGSSRTVIKERQSVGGSVAPAAIQREPVSRRLDREPIVHSSGEPQQQEEEQRQGQGQGQAASPVVYDDRSVASTTTTPVTVAAPPDPLLIKSSPLKQIVPVENYFGSAIEGDVEEVSSMGAPSVASESDAHTAAAYDEPSNDGAIFVARDEGAVDKDSEEVKKLKAEVGRLKREMAAMAAAAAAATTPDQTPLTPTTVNKDGSPAIEATPSSRSSHSDDPGSSWKWTGPTESGNSYSSSATADAAAAATNGEGGLLRSSGRVGVKDVRPDDSWRQRRRSVCEQHQPHHQEHRRSISETVSYGRGSGIGIEFSRAGSVLPTPASDGASSVCDDGSPRFRCNRAAAVALENLTPARHSADSVGEGPSPASGEKHSDAKAAAASAAAATRMRVSIDGCSEYGGGEGEALRTEDGKIHDNITVRPFSVFFPVQTPVESPPSQLEASTVLVPTPTVAVMPLLPRNSPGGTASGRDPESNHVVVTAVTTTGTEATSKTQETFVNTTPKADFLAASSPGTAQEGAAVADRVPTPVVYAQLPARLAPAPAPAVAATGGLGARLGVRRKRLSEADSKKIWRWVLAQRTGNQTVKQAVMSHGLPPLDRRHVWAAWAAVANMEK